MTTTRPYRKALTEEEALARLAQAAGTQLDPQLAMTFVAAKRQALADAHAAAHATAGTRGRRRPAADPSATLGS